MAYDLGTRDRIIPTLAESVTPSDVTDLPFTARWINVKTSGDVSVKLRENGSTVVLHVGAGIPFPIEVDRINATDTNATGIVVMR